MLPNEPRRLYPLAPTLASTCISEDVARSNHALTIGFGGNNGEHLAAQ